MPACKLPEEEASPSAGDHSSTGGSGNSGARSRSALGNVPAAGAEAAFAAAMVTNIFEKYQGIIDASGINASGFRSCTAGTGGCKIAGFEQQPSHSAIDAGSGGTADALAAEPANNTEGMCDNLPCKLTTDVDSGGSGDMCGHEGAAGRDESRADALRGTVVKDLQSSTQGFARDVVKVDDLGSSSLPQALPSTKAPWTFTYFFDDEGL